MLFFCFNKFVSIIESKRREERKLIFSICEAGIENGENERNAKSVREVGGGTRSGEERELEATGPLYHNIQTMIEREMYAVFTDAGG